MKKEALLSVNSLENDELATQYSLLSAEEIQRSRRKVRILSATLNSGIIQMQSILARKIRNKKSYTFQLLKQFLLFPDSSLSSSCLTVSKYDPLLFSD